MNNARARAHVFCIVLFTFLACDALAQAPADAGAAALECGAKGPVDCFISKITLASVKPACEFDVWRWQLLAEAYYRTSGSIPEKPEVHVCIRQQMEIVEPYYRAAREFLTNNQDGLAALKDAYSYWLTSVQQLPDGVFMIPTAANIRANRAQREGRERGFKERLTRLELEK